MWRTAPRHSSFIQPVYRHPVTSIVWGSLLISVASWVASLNLLSAFPTSPPFFLYPCCLGIRYPIKHQHRSFGLGSYFWRIQTETLIILPLFKKKKKQFSIFHLLWKNLHKIEITFYNLKSLRECTNWFPQVLNFFLIQFVFLENCPENFCH